MRYKATLLLKKDSGSKSCKINVIKDYDDLLHFIQIITNEGCVVDKIENIPLQTLTDFTESGNETDKNEKDRYYIILYHKKEEE